MSNLTDNKSILTSQIDTRGGIPMKVSVIGATGYAGAELLRLLYQHPQAEVVHITSESHTGEKIASL